MTCDPNWNQVSLLLPFDGANGQTTTSDLSLNAYGVSNGGGASLSTASPKFGTASSSFSGVTSTNWYVGNMPGGPLDLRQSVFTVELWLKTTASGQGILWSDLAPGDTEYLRGYINNGYIALQAQYDAGSGGGTEGTTAINDGGWHHVVWEANASEFGIAVDGVWLLTGAYNFSGNAVPSGQSFQIGSDATSYEGDSYVGNIDELRITKGVLRYPIGTNFTPPTAAFPTGPCGVVVPDLSNTSVNVAEATLAAVGLVLGTVTTLPSTLVIAGNVISQIPIAGSGLPLNGQVSVVISSGAPQLVVPMLLDQNLITAFNLLTTVGLVPGAISYQSSMLVPAGEVMLQNPTAGTPVASGAFVSFVISTGPPIASSAFDIQATVISQYANSPTLIQLIQNLGQYFDQSTNFAEFYTSVWNIQTAAGFGLDIWGKIVGVSRLLNIPNTTLYVGFENSHSPPDWQTMGSNQPPQPAVGGALYTGYNATTAYLLPDNAYRQLILAKAFANICTTTAPAINQILQNLFGNGNAWVLNTGSMSISYNLNFTPSAIQLAILEQSGVIPTPPGVSFVVNTGV